MPRSSPGPTPLVRNRTSIRGRVDYRMTRRSVLHEVRTGERDLGDVQDAHRELRMAGEHLGEARDEACPICEDDTLRQVTYAFPQRGRSRASGRAMTSDALQAYALRHGEVRVYAVEVCTTCGWHHLLEGYWLVPNRPGRATGRTTPRAQLRRV